VVVFAAARQTAIIPGDGATVRKVALKLLPVVFTSDQDRVLRFEQEARSASALNYPNIITIYELGQVEDIHSIAAGFIDGETLRQRMEKARIGLIEAVDVALQVAQAIHWDDC
jgi:eukaryotic-like serine/threonine-protein kinase